MQKTTAQEISQLVGGQLEGDGQRVIGGMATIESAGPEDLSFIANARYEKHLSQTRAGAVIVSTTCQVPQGLTVIRCQRIDLHAIADQRTDAENPAIGYVGNV